MSPDLLIRGVIIELVVIIVVARLLGALFRKLGLPRVCGEITAGIALGPSILGAAFPGVAHYVFDPALSQIFTALSQLGLILLMFVIGLDFDFSHLRSQGQTAVMISIAGIVAPFGLGLLLANFIYPSLGNGTDRVSFLLFVAIALSITAIPTLGMIMVEFNLSRTRLGSLAITAAAANDVLGWSMLAIIAGSAHSGFAFRRGLTLALEIACYIAVAVYGLQPLLRRFVRWELERNYGEISPGAFSLVLVLLLISANTTNLIGISPVFGGFLMGAILSTEHEFRKALFARLHDVVMVFFLPIFFTYTGLRTDVHSMTSGMLWVTCIAIVLAAFLGKCGGCALAAWLSGISMRDSLSIGVMMNTRGLMELVVINLGYELGVIPKSIFFILVVMALVTTFATGPLLRWTLRHDRSLRLAQVAG